MGWVKDKIFQTGEDFIEWLDGEFGDYIKAHISSLDVHHTWKPNHSNYPKYTTYQLHQNMRTYHMRERGWSDIGQHLTIGKEGNVVLGLPINLPPASAFGHNGNSNWHPFMFEMIGDFDKGQDKLQGAQLATVLSISKYFHLVKKKPIRFHRELDPRKSCPGTGISKTEFMSWVNKKEEDEMLERAIVMNSEIDVVFAADLSKRLKAPIYFRTGKPEGKIAKEVFIVGGLNDTSLGDKVVFLGGKDRYEVAAAVKKHLG